MTDIRIGPMKYNRSEILPFRSVVVGGSGGGKSSLIKKTRIDLAHNGVVIYDLDNADELVGFYREKAPGVPVYPISAKYADGVGIDITNMISSASKRWTFATKLVPEVRGEVNPFFTTMARLLIDNGAEAMHTLSEGKVLLADVMRVCMNPQLQSILSESAGLGNPYSVFGQNDSRRDTEATIIAKLKPLSIFAAVDLHCSTRIKLPLTSGIAVFEWSDDIAPAMETFYAYLFDFISSRLLSEKCGFHSAFIIDEFRVLKPLECIRNLAMRGRKAMCSMMLSLHEITGVYDRYGKDTGEEILGLMDYRMAVKIGSPMTAEWASKYLGYREVVEEFDEKRQSVKMRPNVTPDEIRHMLDVASYEKDIISGYYDFPTKSGKFSCPFRKDVTLLNGTADRELRPDSHQTLPRFKVEDFARLGIPITPEILRAIG